MSSLNLSFKIVLLGDSASQTIFVNRYLTKSFVENLKITIGFEFYSKRISVDGHKINLQFWELNGQPRFRFLLPNYIKMAAGGLFLYDVTDRSSIARIDEWLSVITKGLRGGKIFPIIAVGIVTGDISKRQISAEEGLKIANSRNLNGHTECKFKTGKKVEKVFEDLTRLVLIKAGLLKSP